MSSNKPAAPKPLWAVQLLTTEYLVDGYLEGDDPASPFFLTVQGQDLVGYTLTLTEATVRPTGALSAKTLTAARWLLPGAAGFVAVIPRDAASTDYFVQNRQASNYTFPASVFVGPYLIRGTILSKYAAFDVPQDYPTVAMQDATIDCLTPGSPIAGLAAPNLVLRTLLLHGIVLEG